MLFSPNFSSYTKKFTKNLIKSNQYSHIFTEKTKINFTNFSYFNIFFIKKERIYTKLKYSRVPQFDVASGGIASLVAAMFACLVTEKFGVELVDSGDFYSVIMYLIFFLLIIKTVTNLFDKDLNKFILFSTSNIIEFYKKIFLLLVKFVKNFTKNN